MSSSFTKVKNWDVFAFVVGIHLLAVVLLPFVWGDLTWAAFVFFIVTYFIGGISITAGYHRLYSHKAYSAHPIFEWAVLLGSTLAWQWSALTWSHDHRLHHKHVDTDADPYSIKKGFWYAHFLWLFDYQRNFRPDIVTDLLCNPRVVFQDKYYLVLALSVNFLVWGAACFFVSPLAAFFAAVLMRVLMILHSTWFINSLAHVWGSRTYAKELSAVDNAMLALVTFGEGYHNYHHIFASDYRNGIRWYHFDPTKWLIWTSSKLGLVGGLRTVHRVRLQKALVKQDHQILSKRLSSELDEVAHDIRNRLNDLSKAFDENSTRLLNLYQELVKASSDKRDFIKVEIRNLRRDLRATWRAWVSLTSMAARKYALAH